MGRQALDLFNFEIDGVELAFEDVDVGELITSLAERQRPNAEAKGIWLSVKLGDRLGTAAWDVELVGQAVAQIVGNAVKFTHEGGVTVTVRRVGDDVDGAVVIDVEDTGVGIAPQRMPRLFESFAVARDASARHRGVGLSLSRSLCRLMGGEISARSQLGKGSCFKLRLPTNFSAVGLDPFDALEPGAELAAA